MLEEMLLLLLFLLANTTYISVDSVERISSDLPQSLITDVSFIITNNITD